MALKGKLRDFSLEQLLKLVHLARKTGALSIESANRAAELFFQEGKLTYATLSGQSGALADLMVGVGKLTQSQADSLTATGRTWDDKQLAILLINAGRITRDDILQALHQHVLGVVNTVFNWEDGTFIFDQKMLPPTGRIALPGREAISLDSIVVEGSRRREEAAELQDELPSLEVVLRFTDGPGRNLRNINLSVDEWRVISFINPRNTVATIAQYNQMSEHQVRRIVAKLLRDQLVEIVGSPGRSAAPRPAPIPAATAPQPAARPATPPAQEKPKFTEPQVDKGIIRRLIARIRGL